MAGKKSTFQLRLEEELKERAEKAAQRKGVSVSGLFRIYLIEGLDRDEERWGTKKSDVQ